MTVVGTDDVAGEEGGPVGDAPLLLRPAEAAALLGIGRTKLYELLSSGRLASVQIDRSRRVPRASVAAFVEELQGGRGPELLS